MKTCTKCNPEKELTEFYSKGTRTQSYCKSCFNSYCIERWRKRKQDAIESFGGKCHDCNKEYHPAVFEFHNLDPTQKDVDWSKLRLRSKEAISLELSKCVMLCANCHRIRHID